MASRAASGHSLGSIELMSSGTFRAATCLFELDMPVAVICSLSYPLPGTGSPDQFTSCSTFVSPCRGVAESDGGLRIYGDSTPFLPKDGPPASATGSVHLGVYGGHSMSANMSAMRSRRSFRCSQEHAEAVMMSCVDRNRRDLLS